MSRRSLFTAACLLALLPATMPSPGQADEKPTTGKKPAKSENRSFHTKNPAVGQTSGKKRTISENHNYMLGGVSNLAFSPDGKTFWWSVGTNRRKLGLSVSPADPVLRTHVPETKGKLGLVVTGVVKDSPAAKAGIQPNDILLTLEGKPLSKVTDLSVSLQQAKKLSKATLLRSGKPLRLRIRVPKQKQFALEYMNVYGAGSGGSKYIIGINTANVDATLAAQLVLPPSTGLVITHVTKDSPAAKAGLKQHDVILTADDQYVSNVQEFGKVLDKAAGKPVTIEFVRAGRKQTCKVTPKKREPVKGIRFSNQGTLLGIKEYEVTLDHEFKPVRFKRRPKDLNSQVDRLSKQIDELRNTLDAIKKQLPAGKSKPKK